MPAIQHRRIIHSGRIPISTMLGVAILAGCSSSSTASDGAASITVVSGDQQIAGVGAALPTALAVVLKDMNGAPVQGITVHFVSPLSGASFSVAEPVTDVNGMATTLMTLPQTPGVDTVQATDSVSGLVAQFVETATTGPAKSFAADSGFDQTAAHGTALPQPLVALVVDKYGNPVVGIAVTWSTTAGTLSALFSTTDGTGRARTGLTLPATAGQVTVTATLDAPPLTALFIVTGT